MLTRSESIGHLALAMTQARMKFLPLGKDREAKITSSRTGTTFSYDYADLADCYDAVIGALSEAGIAVFQPVSTVGEHAVSTTLLVHGESGEWISNDLAMPIADVGDARAVGSAGTYAKRYNLQGLLSVAPADEDDDAQTARGGDHEMSSKTAPAPRGARPVCPVCGKDAIIKGKPEYGGGWVCFGKKGGCGAKWDEGPFPTAAPVPDRPAGIVSLAQAEKEAEELFPENAREIFDSTYDSTLLGQAVDLLGTRVKSEPVRKKLWDQACSPTPYGEMPTRDQLRALLKMLGAS